MGAGETVVVPVLAVPHEQWSDRYPLLGDKLYLPWSLGPDEVARRIAARFEREPSDDWYCDHPIDYLGPVWIRVNARGEGLGRDHNLTARWGRYIRRIELPVLGEDPVSLAHHKEDSDSATLHVEIHPAAVVTFGQGLPPDGSGINFDEGWSRSAGWTFPSS
jgi:hypothetical protein